MMMEEQEETKHENNIIWFKSTLANGMCFLSNSWPDVSPPAKKSTSRLEHIPGHQGAFIVDGLSYKTVEHFYQAQLYNPLYPEIAEVIRKQPTAYLAKLAANRFRFSHPIDQRSIESKRCHIMSKGLWEKFSQNPALACELVNTGDAMLCQMPSKSDVYWSAGTKASVNQLGNLLMAVREALQASIVLV